MRFLIIYVHLMFISHFSASDSLKLKLLSNENAFSCSHSSKFIVWILWIAIDECYLLMIFAFNKALMMMLILFVWIALYVHVQYVSSPKIHIPYCVLSLFRLSLLNNMQLHCTILISSVMKHWYFINSSSKIELQLCWWMKFSVMHFIAFNEQLYRNKR